MTHRLLSRSACRPCVHTNRSSGKRPGRHSFQSPPGNGLKLPSAVASPTDGVGTSVQRGKLPKSLPRGETAALVIMTLPDEATIASSMWPTILQRPSGLDTCVARCWVAATTGLRRLSDIFHVDAAVLADAAQPGQSVLEDRPARSSWNVS